MIQKRFIPIVGKLGRLRTGKVRSGHPCKYASFAFPGDPADRNAGNDVLGVLGKLSGKPEVDQLQ